MLCPLGVLEEEEAAMPQKEFAEIVTRRFRIERGPEGEVVKCFVDSRGHHHWYLAWTGNQAGRWQDLRWIDISQLLAIDLVVPPPGP
jgi:hypothetical protein